MTTVAACVVVKDRRDAMARCLDGITMQTRPADEIVVVDNESSDGTWELLRERARSMPALLVDRQPGTLGRVRNVAVGLASADVVAFTDSDCVPEPGWLAAGLVPFGHASVGVVQGRTVPARQPTRRWSATQDIATRSGLFEACNVFYRREPLVSVGGFDESLGFFGEDTAAGWRMLRAGWTDAFAATAVVRHDVTTPGLGWQLRRAARYVNWPALIAQFPERRDLLWGRMFLRQRSAVADLALVAAAAAAATRSGWPLLAAAPFAWTHRPRGVRPGNVADSAGDALFDLVVSGALMTGSLRSRTLVL